jgi:putative transposase
MVFINRNIRFQNWNYGFAGDYFITICTENKNELFGNVFEDKMYNNELGDVLEKEWLKTPSLRKDMNLTLGKYQLMPNHFHAIITIGINQYNNWSHFIEVEKLDPRILYSKDLLLHHKKGTVKGPQLKNLSSVIRGFKSSVTTYARKQGNYMFNWQRSFHDHLIRDDKTYNKISRYIENNPMNWDKDRFRPK